MQYLESINIINTKFTQMKHLTAILITILFFTAFENQAQTKLPKPIVTTNLEIYYPLIIGRSAKDATITISSHLSSSEVTFTSSNLFTTPNDFYSEDFSISQIGDFTASTDNYTFSQSIHVTLRWDDGYTLYSGSEGVYTTTNGYSYYVNQTISSWSTSIIW